MRVLREQDYRHALTRLMFYSLSGGSYGPSRPTIDRIRHAGPLRDRARRADAPGALALLDALGWDDAPRPGDELED